MGIELVECPSRHYPTVLEYPSKYKSSVKIEQYLSKGNGWRRKEAAEETDGQPRW